MKATAPQVHWDPGAGETLSVRVVRHVEALTEYAEDWEGLAAEALEPNPFYEPWTLIPLLRAFGGRRDLRIVLVLSGASRHRDRLSAVFPLERLSRYKGLPVPALAFWSHNYVPLSTPLVRATRARECLNAFFAWLESNEADAPLLELGNVTGDGRFDQLLSEHLHRHARLGYVVERSTRAFFSPRASAGEYLATACSGVHLKGMRRLHRRLAELGDVTFERLGPDGDVDAWLREFLTLEARGWKGRAGTALASDGASQDFLLTVGREAFRRRRLHMLALRLQGRSIAMKLNLLAAPGAFAFKIAFDEALARFSPGVMLELENIRALHAMRDVAWMDSCAIANHPMIDRLWLDRRVMQTLVVSSGRAPGDLLVSVLPLLRWANRRWQRRYRLGTARS